MREEHRPMVQGPGLEEGAARLTLRPRGPSYSHQEPGASARSLLSAPCSPTGLAQSLRVGTLQRTVGS